jgi:hypothetical protein
VVTPRKPETAHKVTALIHSVPGNGKTHFLGTAQEDPRTFPMAFVNFESGEQTLSGLDIDVFDIRDTKDWDEVYRDLRKPTSPYKSFGIDSITEYQIASLLEILGKDTINRADPEQLGQQDWGIVLVRMRRIVRQYVKMIDAHCFITALSKDEIVPRIGTVKVPSVQGQFSNELPGIVDVVAYLALEDIGDGEVRRLLLLHGYPKFSVKARTPWGVTVPTEIEDPTVTKLLDALGVAGAKRK